MAIDYICSTIWINNVCFFQCNAKKKIKKAGYPKLNGSLVRVKQSKTIETNLTQEEIINILKASDEFRKIKRLTNSIILKKMSMFSLGEIITISFSTKNSSKIKIESKPSMPTTLIDYGINISNVDNVIKVIKTGKEFQIK